MKEQIKLITAASAGLALSAHATGIVTVTGVTGHNGGNWQPTSGHLSDALNGNLSNDLGTGDHDPGMRTATAPENPATWTYSGFEWEQEWKASSSLDSTTTLNNKIGWMVVDFGSVTKGLLNMYLWNARSQNDTENIDSYNIYYSSGVGIDTLPAMPESKTTTGDYDFSSGDWQKLNSSALKLAPNPSDNQRPQAYIELGKISAQFIGIEVLTRGSGDTSAGRLGLSQVEFTCVPKPTITALLDIGGITLTLRDRK